MSRICKLIEGLRGRSDIGIVEEKQSWLIEITKGRDLICEINVPYDVLEWHACVRERGKQKVVWSDWMDYSGYDEKSKEELEAEMAEDIEGFLNRVSTSEPLLPLRIFEART